MYGSRGRDLDDPSDRDYRVHESRRPSLAATTGRAPRRSNKPSYESGRKYRSTGNLFGKAPPNDTP